MGPGFGILVLKLKCNKAKPRTPDDELGRQEVEVGSSCCLELELEVVKSRLSRSLSNPRSTMLAVVQILCPSCSNRLQLNGSFVLGRNGTACSTSHQNRALAHSKEHPECAHLCLLKWQSGVASATTLDAVGVELGGLTLSSEMLPI